jgi:hypothetical protein
MHVSHNAIRIFCEEHPQARNAMDKVLFTRCIMTHKEYVKGTSKS